MASDSWTSIIQHRKRWLIDKMAAIRVICEDTMSVYERNLYHTLSEPFRVATEILDRPERALSLEEMVIVGRQLEDTCNRLLNHFSNICSTPGSQASSATHTMSPWSGMNLPHADPQSDGHTVTDYLQLVSTAAGNDTSQPENLNLNGNFASGLSEAQSNNGNSASNITSQFGLCPASSDLVPPELKPPEENSAPDQRCINRHVSSPVPSISQAALDNYPTSIPSLLHEELFEKPFWGKISDVLSPSCFSIQVSSYFPLLEDLQKELNLFYTSKHHAALSLTRPPLVGDYCAVVYPNDGIWYRACVTCVILPDVIVEYVDYGNSTEVKWKSAMKLAAWFYGFPRMSICCTMSDIIPVAKQEDESKCRAWEEIVIEWFDSFVYGNIYQVEITEEASDSNQVGVRLYCVDCIESVVPVKWNVANLMVNLKHACFKNEGPTMTIDQGFLEQLKQCTIEDPVCNNKVKSNNVCCASSGKSDIHSVKRSLIEKADISDETNSDKTSGDKLSVRNLSTSSNKPVSKENTDNERIAESFWSPKKSARGYEASLSSFSATDADRFLTPTCTTYSEDNIINNESDKMEKWNPMAEDFNSVRNSCSVDTENACVAVEGIDPTPIDICRFHKQGNCWRGDKCPRSHQKKSYTGELKTEIAVFSGSSLKSLTLRKDSWNIIKVTHVINIDLFYVHFIDTLSSIDKILGEQIQGLPDIPAELALLMDDMQKYYKSKTQGLKDLIQPCNGEMLAVKVDDTFYRGMVLDSTCGHIKAFLIDFGKEILVSEHFYRPMNPAFMHLPKQAIHCAWKESISQNMEYERVKKFISLTENGYFAMKIEGYCPETDGPHVVSLYHVNGNGLQKLKLA